MSVHITILGLPLCACAVSMLALCSCVSAVQAIIHFLRARRIVWLVQSVPTLQKFGKGDWVHSRVGNLSSSEKLPASYSIGPLQRRTSYIGCFVNYSY